MPMRARLLTGCLLLSLLTALPPAYAQDVSIDFDIDAPPPVAVAPPALPIYVVPAPPVDYGYVWTPGYWAWDGYDYFWVPGTWIAPPAQGLLWTPGYWGWNDGAYAWHPGYWGPHIGFYGGINYGGGYDGVGFHGGHWRGGRYFVDRSQLNVTIGNAGSRVSFNGGAGGLRMRPTAAQMAAAHDHHVQPTGQQLSHIRDAAQNPALEQSHNHGAPPIAATVKPGDFSHGFAARKAGPVNPAAQHYNAQVLQNPSAAKAAVPQARPAEQQRPEPQHAEPPVQHIEQPRTEQHIEQQQSAPHINEMRMAPATAPALQEQPRIEQPRAPEQPHIEQPHMEQPHPQQPHPEAPHAEPPHPQEQQHEEAPHPEGGEGDHHQ